MHRYVQMGSLCLLLVGCGGESDPFAPDDNPGTADAAIDDPVDTTPADAGATADAGTLACADSPARLIVLGDSIVACSNVGGKNDDRCSPNVFHQHVASTYAGGITYENLSVPGAVTAGVTGRQLDQIETGRAGHALVLIYIGGNDLQPYIFISDGAAEDRFARDMPAILSEWDAIFAFFADTSRFPDGVTIMMNNQYNPFDDCTASPYNLSALKIALLGQYNQELADLAAARGNVVLTDQHSSYLGHGHHYNVASCPHYRSGADPWMGDLIHPNGAGHANLAAEWRATAARLYADCQ